MGALVMEFPVTLKLHLNIHVASNSFRDASTVVRPCSQCSTAAAAAAASQEGPS